MAANHPKRRGRPPNASKDSNDAGASEELQEVHGADDPDREDGEVSPAAETDDAGEGKERHFSEVSQHAASMRADGHEVTQLHTKSDAPEKHWSYNGMGASVHSNSDGDYVVTADGKKHHI